MSIECIIDYKDKPYEYVWFNPAPGLDEDVKERIVWQIIDMYYDGDDIRHIDNKEYCARIVKKDRASLGMFVGNRFDAEFETDKISKSGLSILLLDFVDPRTN